MAGQQSHTIPLAIHNKNNKQRKQHIKKINALSKTFYKTNNMWAQKSRSKRATDYGVIR